MLSHKAAPFYVAVWNLRRLHARLEKWTEQEKKVAITDKDRRGIEKHLTALCESLKDLEATGTCSVAEVALDDLKTTKKATYGKYLERVNSLHQVLVKELSKTELFVLHRADLVLFDPREPPFGQAVEDKFPDARFDIEEAGKCLALGRPTACIFHLMRAVEDAAFVLAKKLRATGQKKNGERLTLGVLTATIKGKIDAKPAGKKKDDWLKIHMFLHACNRAFRTKSAHPGKKYNPEEAQEAYGAARTFMRAMAELA